MTDRAWIEIDSRALAHNLAALSALGPALMPTVKANAYGHGAVPIARFCEAHGIHAFCVASAQEARQLREGGITGDILILGATGAADLPLLWQYDLTQTIVDIAYGQWLHSQVPKPVRCHIKLDTGMHRLGADAGDLEAIEALFTCSNLHIQGVYTHLPVSDSQSRGDIAYTEYEGEELERCVQYLRDKGHRYLQTHICASYGLLFYPQLGGDWARVGIALYGTLSRTEDLARCPVPLQPVLSLKARVALVRTVSKGTGVGYGLTWCAPKPCTLAVLSIGYADGVPRAFGGHVLLHGCLAPVIGRICMDMLTVDVTEIPSVQAGDIATLIGCDGVASLSACDMATACGTISNEILSRLGPRLPRIWV